ncbi:unnamed protein product, partial [Urochloa humidicola]
PKLETLNRSSFAVLSHPPPASPARRRPAATERRLPPPCGPATPTPSTRPAFSSAALSACPLGVSLRHVKMNSAGLHQMIGRSMVELSILPPRAQPKSFKRVRHFYGIIIVLKPNFAYVVADPKFFVGKLHGRLKLYFDGNRSITYD